MWHSKDVGIWIDMNEPACFEKTDKTMPKSNLHKVAVFKSLVGLGEEELETEEVLLEHRYVHSLYGFMSS